MHEEYRVTSIVSTDAAATNAIPTLIKILSMILCRDIFQSPFNTCFAAANCYR